MDFKGWFRTGDGLRVEPLTVRDLYSRYVLLVKHVSAQSDAVVRRLVARLFREEGLPEVIRFDNGPPFGGIGPLGLARLSVWLLQLGVQVEFSRPAHPQDNAAHEQMHGILKKETANPPAATRPQQQRRFDSWRRLYNHHRPHESLGMRVPAQLYRRRWNGRLPPWKYAPHSILRRVSHGGWISWHARRRLIGRAFAGQTIALVAHDEHHRVHLGPHLIGTLHAADPGGIRPARRTTRTGRGG